MNRLIGNDALKVSYLWNVMYSKWLLSPVSSHSVLDKNNTLSRLTSIISEINPLLISTYNFAMIHISPFSAPGKFLPRKSIEWGLEE